MGLLTKIFGEPKEDYATQFKNCIENSCPNVMTILKEWRNEYPNDANRYYANIIYECKFFSGEVKGNEIYATVCIANRETPVNRELSPWYKSMAEEYSGFRCD